MSKNQYRKLENIDVLLSDGTMYDSAEVYVSTGWVEVHNEKHDVLIPRHRIERIENVG